MVTNFAIEIWSRKRRTNGGGGLKIEGEREQTVPSLAAVLNKITTGKKSLQEMMEFSRASKGGEEGRGEGEPLYRRQNIRVLQQSDDPRECDED